MTGEGPIRMVMVDDHRIVREGLRAMLHGVAEIEIVGEAEDLPGALAAIEQSTPDVVLLDLRLQRSSGLDACRAIVERFPDVRVVFLTVYEDEQYVFEALRAGGRGYMLKEGLARGTGPHPGGGPRGRCRDRPRAQRQDRAEGRGPLGRA